MKDTDIPEISSTWWKKNQPATLSATGLGEALRGYEAARKLAQPTQVAKEIGERLKTYDTAIEKLDDLTPAVAKAQGKCNKTLHGTCLKVLTKYPTVLIKEKELLKREREAMVKGLAQQIESTKLNGNKILAKVIDDVKALEKLLQALEALVDDAEDTEAEVAKAVSDNEPNAGELEVSVTEGYVRDATKLAKELVSLADKAEKQALNDWQRDFDLSLTHLDRQVQFLADKCELQCKNFEMARDKAEKARQAIEASAKSVREMAEGQGDLEGQYLKTCLALEGRTQKILGVVRAAFAEAGGCFDRAKFNAMNFLDRQHPTFGDRSVLDEAKVALQRGIAALNTGKSELNKGRTAFDRAIKGLPDFVTKANLKFREVLDALEKAAAAYEDYGRQATQLAGDANKAAETYKKSL